MALKLQTLFETPADQRMSAQEYIDSPDSERKSDLIEGVFILASPVSRNHERVVSFITSTLANFVSSKQLGEVTTSNAAYRLSPDNVYQPDVSFVRTERLHLAHDVYFDGPPDIAVEVISPSSRHYDTFEKKLNYGRFGVGEYWLIDPANRQATFYTQIDGQLIALPTKDDVLRSQLLDGYWLRLAWLFPPEGSERPSELEIAKEQGLI